MATKAKPVSEKQTKAQIVSALAEETGLTKSQITALLDTMASMAHRHLMKKDSGEFAVPSLGAKLRRVTKPARPARKGRNPATGTEITIKAQPAREVIKAVPLKALKDCLG
jgi:nucleoid DNA-binding protein